MFSGGSGRPVPRRGRRRGLLPRRRGSRSCTTTSSPISRRGELPHGPPRVAGRGDPHRRIRGHGRRGRDPGRQARPARRHRRRAQPRLRPRLPVAGVRRRLDGQLRVRSRVRRSASARCSRRAGRWPSCSTSTPARPCARRSSVMKANGISQLPGVQEHAAVRQRRGVRLGRRARPDGGDLPRPVGHRHAGRAGDGPAAADDRRRPDDRAGGARCSRPRRRCSCCRAAGRWP